MSSSPARHRIFAEQMFQIRKYFEIAQLWGLIVWIFPMWDCSRIGNICDEVSGSPVCPGAWVTEHPLNCAELLKYK